MSREIDERVVKMEFDNERFEKNAQTSLSTLEKLKKALDFKKNTEDPLEAMAKSAGSLNKISAAVDSLNAKFSTLGTIKRQVVKNLTDTIYGTMAKLGNASINGIIEGGFNRAMNVENAKFMLEGLVGEGEKLDAILQQAKDSVDGTAYSYDTAAKAASMFTASGIESGKQLTTAMSALADVTAATNSDYEGMSQIFTTVAGNGRLMGDQLLQLSSRGMNAAAIIQKYFQEVRGEAGMTEETVRDMVSKGQIDFTTFVEAMEHQYAGHAKKANDTFNGVTANIKAKLAQIGEGFYSELIVKKGPLVQFLNAVKDVLQAVKQSENLADLQKAWNVFAKDKLSEMTKVLQGMVRPSKYVEGRLVAVGNTFRGLIKFTRRFLVSIKNLFLAVQSWITPIGEAFFEVFQPIKEGLWEKAGDALVKFTKSLILNKKGMANLKSVAKALFTILKSGFNIIKLGLMILKPIAGILLSIVGAVIKAIGFVASLGNALFDLVVNGKGASKFITDLADSFGDFGGAIGAKFASAIRSITSFIGYLKNQYFPNVNKLSDINLDTAKDAFGALGLKIQEFANKAGAALHQVNFDNFKEGVSKAVTNVRNIIVPIVKEIPSLIGKIGQLIIDGFKGIRWDDIGKIFSTVAIGIIKAIPTIFGAVADAIVTVFQNIDWSKIGSVIAEGMLSIADHMGELLSQVPQAISKIAKAISDTFQKELSGKNFKIKFPFLGQFQEALSDIPGTLKKGMKAIMDVFDYTDFKQIFNTALVSAYSIQILRLVGAFKKLVDSTTGFVGSLEDVSGSVKDFIDNKLGVQEDKIDTLKRFGMALMLVAGSVAIVAGSLFLLSKIPFDELVNGLKGLAACAGALIVFAAAMAFFDKMDITIDPKQTFSLIEFAAALFIMANALEKLSKVKISQENIAPIGVAVGALVAIAWSLGREGGLGSGAQKGIKQMAKFLLTMVVIMKILSSMRDDNWDAIVFGLAVIIGSLVSISLIADKIDLRGMEKLWDLAGPLLIMAAAMVVLGHTNLEGALAGVIAMGAVLTELYMFCQGTSEMDLAATATALGTFAVSMAGIMLTLGVAGSYAKQVAIGLGLFAAALLVLGGAAAAVFYIPGLAEGLLILAVSLDMIGVAALAFGAGVALIGAGCKMIVSSLLELIEVGDKLPKLAANVVDAIGVMCAKIVQWSPVIMRAVATILKDMIEVGMDMIPELVEFGMLMVAGVLQGIADHSGELINALADLFVNCCNAVADRADEFIDAGINLVVSLVDGIGRGLIKYAPDIETAVSNFLDGVLGNWKTVVEVALGKLTGFIGKGLGDLLDAAVEEFLPALGDSLTEFSHHAEEFITTMTGIGPETLHGIKEFAQAIKMLVTSGWMNIGDSGFDARKFEQNTNNALPPLLEFITTLGDRLVGKNISSADDNLGRLGKLGAAISDFATQVDGIGDLVDDDDVSGMERVHKIIEPFATVMASLPRTGGANGAINGNIDFEKFAYGFRQLVSAMISISTIGGLDQINPDFVMRINMIGSALEALGNAAQSLPMERKGTLVNETPTDLAAFAQQIYRAANSMIMLATDPRFGAITEDFSLRIANITKAISAMADAAEQIPPKVGFFKKLFKNPTSLEEFASDMCLAAEKVSEIATGMQGIQTQNFEKVVMVANAVWNMSSAAKMISQANFNYNGGAVDGLITMIEELAKIKDKISEFANVGNNIKIESLEKLHGAITEIKAISAEAKSGSGGDLSKFAKSLSTLKKNLKSLNTTLGGIDTDALKTKLQEIVNLTDGLDTSAFDSFTTALTTALDDALTAADEYKKQFHDAGEALGGQLKKGLEAAKSKVQTAGRTIASAAAIAAKSDAARAFMKFAGEYVGRGFIEGLDKTLSDVKAKAREIASEAAAATAAAAKVNSPSKVFIGLGQYVGQGFVVGIQNTFGAVRKTSSQLGTESIKAAQNTLGIHSPSKAFQTIGKWAVKGYLKGFTTESKKTKTQMSKAFGSAVKYFAKTVEADTKKVGKLRKSLKEYKKALADAVKGKQRAEKDLNNPKTSAKDKKFAKDALNYYKKLIGTYKSEIAGLEKKIKGAKKLITDKNLLKAIGQMSGWLGGKVKKATAKAVKNDSTAARIQKQLSNAKKDLAELKKSRKEAEKILNNPKASAADKKKAQQTLNKITDKDISKAEAKVKSLTDRYNARIKALAKSASLGPLKQVKAAFGDLRKELEAIDKGLSKVLLKSTESVVKYIKNSKDASKWVPSLTKSFNAMFKSDKNSSYSYYSSQIKNIKSQKSKIVKANKSINKELKKLQDKYDKEKNEKEKKSLKKQMDALLKQRKSNNKKIENLDKQLSKAQKKQSLSTASGVLGAFGDQLYKASDSYKQTAKNLKQYAKEMKKLKKELKAAGKDEKKVANIRKQIRELNKKIGKETKNLAQGAEKALKSYRKEIKNTWKEYAKLANIQIADKLFSGFNWEIVEKTTEQVELFSNALSGTLKGSANAASSSVESLTEAFDILSGSMDTGMDFFNKFTKTGSAEVSALFEYADSNLTAYEEFQNKLEQMSSMGFSQDLIDELEDKGLDAVNYVRGFVNMSAEDVEKYNDLLKQKNDYETKRLQRSLERMQRQYQDWMDKVNAITTNELINEEVRKKLEQKFKSAGFSSSYAFVKAFASLSADDANAIGDIFLTAISDNFTGFTKELSDGTTGAGQDAGSKLYDSFYESFKAKRDENEAWEEKLAKLIGRGFSEEVVEQFRQAGKDSAESWVDSCLDEAKTSVDQIAEINEWVAKELEEKSTTSFEAGIKAIEDENKAYADYAENRGKIEQKISDYYAQGFEARRQALSAYSTAEYEAHMQEKEQATESAKRLSYVMENIAALGYEEAEGIRLLAGATVEEVDRMYDALKQRDKNNATNSWESLKEGEQAIADTEKQYNSLFKYFSKMSAKDLFADLWADDKDAAIKAHEEFMEQIKAMGPEEGLKFMQTLKTGMQTDQEGFKEFMNNFYETSFKMPNTISNTVTSGMAAVLTGALEVWDEAAEKSAKQVTDRLAKSFTKSIEEADLKTIGQKAVTNLASGIKNKTSVKKATDAATETGTQTKDAIKKQLSASKGKKIGEQFLTGAANALTAQKDTVKQTAVSVGKATANGMASGIDKNTPKIKEAAERAARAALEAAKKELGIKSPSKVFAKMGRYVDEGFAEGIRSNLLAVTLATDQMTTQMVSNAQEAVDKIGELNDLTTDVTPVISDDPDVMSKAVANMQAAMRHISDVINGEIDPNPVITPVLDVSSIRDGVREINGMIESANSNVEVNGQNQNAESNSGTTFIQNNYSPESLSRLEIYRQTKNLFAQASQRL